MLSHIQTAMTIAAFPNMTEGDKLSTLAKAAQRIASVVFASLNWELTPVEQARVDELRALQAEHIAEGCRLYAEAAVALGDGNYGTAARLASRGKQQMDIGAEYGRMANEIECRPTHLRPEVSGSNGPVWDDREIEITSPTPIGSDPINPAPIGW